MHPALRKFLVVLLVAAAPLAMAGECDTVQSARQSVESFGVTMKAMADKHNARKAELEAEMKALMKKMVDSKRWTQEQHDRFFKEQRETPEVQAEIAALNKRASGKLGAGLKAGTLIEEHARKGEFIQACQQIKPYRDAMSVIAEVGERDLTFRLSLVKKAYAR